MTVGKYLNLREAIQKELLERFANEHMTAGNREQFNDVLTAMIKTPSTADQASAPRKRRED